MFIAKRSLQSTVTLRNTRVFLCVRVFEEAQVGLVTFKHSAGSCSKQKVHHMNNVWAFLPLMVSPSSTPLFFGSLTWKVPLLGTTDSVIQTHTVLNTRRTAMNIYFKKKKQIILFIQLVITRHLALALISSELLFSGGKQRLHILAVCLQS